MAHKPTPWFYWRDQSLFVHVYLQPRASHDQVVGVMTCPGHSQNQEECLKIRLTAPPLEGRANQHLIKFLARRFKVPEQRVIMTHGEQSRKKWLRIDNPTDLSMLNENSSSQ